MGLSSRLPKGRILTIMLKKLREIEKPSLLNFMNLSMIFCSRL